MRRHHLYVATGVIFFVTGVTSLISGTPALAAVFCPLSVVWFALARKRKAAPPSDPPG